MARFRTRQAPSPTGYLHIGTARTMLFTALLAKAQKGEWFLRLEDTDRTRLVPNAAHNILNSLNAIGLHPDDGITLEEAGKPDEFYGVYQKGKYKPYIQSERLSIYHEHAQNMLDKKLAYWSYVTEEEKQDLLAVKKASKRPINYFVHAEKSVYADKMFQSLEDGLNDPLKPALRYHILREEKITCTDLLLGETTFDLSLEEDFIIIKSDGFPTYHFAHVIDDHLMDTTLVIRSQEWYPSFGKNRQMFLDYWSESPDYMHLPFILGETGNKKLSKRDMVVDLMHYLQSGYIPEAIINYLAFLGWNPGTEQELFLNADEVIETQVESRLEKLLNNISEQFTFQTLSKSPARFNSEKLKWFNREYIKLLPIPEFIERATTLQELDIHTDSLSEWERATFLLDHNRSYTLADPLVESSAVLNYTQPEDALITWKKLTTLESKICLKDVWEQVIEPFYQSDSASSILQQQQQLWSIAFTRRNPSQVHALFQEIAHVFELVIKDWLTTYNKDTGSHLWPLRVSLSGKEKSPSPFELLALLPAEEVKKRIVGILE